MGEGGIISRLKEERVQSLDKITSWLNLDKFMWVKASQFPDQPRSVFVFSCYSNKVGDRA